MEQAGALTLTDVEGSLLNKPVEFLLPEDAAAIRMAAKRLRGRRFRMLVRCDACFEAGRPDGMRGEINPRQIELECRCRFLRYEGASL